MPSSPGAIHFEALSPVLMCTDYLHMHATALELRYALTAVNFIFTLVDWLELALL